MFVGDPKTQYRCLLFIICLKSTFNLEASLKYRSLKQRQVLNLAKPFSLIKCKQYAVLIDGTLQSWNEPNKEGSGTVVDATFGSEQLFLPVPDTEFELLFEMIWVSCLRYG